MRWLRIWRRSFCRQLRHCERSEAIQFVPWKDSGLLRRLAPRNDDNNLCLVVMGSRVRRDDRAYYAPKLRGEPATGVGPFEVTRMTARPRSLVPSGRNRNRPSMPAKPDELSRTSVVKRLPPCVRDSAATSATASYASVAVRTGSPPYLL